MTEEAIKQVLRAGILLSSEHDLNRLLDAVLMSVMSLANCDAGTLYLLEDDGLHFKIMHTNSLGTHTGGDGNDPDLPPVPLKRENVCAFSLLENRTVRIEDVHSSDEYDFSGPVRYDAITGYHTQSMLVVPMTNREGKKLGVIQLINALDENGNVRSFPDDMILALESMTSQSSITIQNVLYMQDIKELFQSFVRVMSSAIDERSPYNANHSRRMAENGARFVDFLNAKAQESGLEEPFSDERKDALVMSIWLHDVGKVVTPLAIMNKEARLSPLQSERIINRLHNIELLARISVLEGSITDDEYRQIRRDTEETREKLREINRVGFLTDEKLEYLGQLKKRIYVENGKEFPWITDDEYEQLTIRKGTLSPSERMVMENHVKITRKLLSQIHFSRALSDVPEWAAAHHELLDGSGYPNHLTADEIPMEVRIITILDIFDALVAEDRPYKPGIPVPKALSILTSMAEEDGKLDAQLTKLFAESKCWEIEDPVAVD